MLQFYQNDGKLPKPRKQKSYKSKHCDCHNQTDGSGLLSDIKDGISSRIQNFGKVRTNIPPASRKVLADFGDRTIVSGLVCRKPINSAVALVVKGLAKNLPYDKLFHLFVLFTLDDQTKVKLEKNAVLNFQVFKGALDKDFETKPISIPPGIKLSEAVDKTQKRMGSKFAVYNAINNCQVFIQNLLEANGMKSDLAFILQDVTSSFSKPTSKFFNFVTDIASRVDLLIKGKGFADLGVHPLTNIEINEYFKSSPFYVGTFSKDTLPRTIGKGKALIMNMANLADVGTHWVAIVNTGKQIFYFDSYGLPPPNEALALMKRSGKHLYFNNSQLQFIDTVTCGYFCIALIDMILRHHKTIYDALYTLHQKPSDFNERFVSDFFSSV